MIPNDAFSQHYAEFLEDAYDVVDRLVLNAYFPLGQSAGGFRTWWRSLEGDDESLDNAHLMRLAGRFSRRLRAWAKKNGIAVVNCAAGERKGEIAAEYLPCDPSFRGIFAVLVGRAPASVWEVERFGSGGINLKRKLVWVNHYSFHLVDEEWGHVMIKICAMAALVTLLDKVIKPLLAGAGKTEAPPRQPDREGTLDRHYEAIQREMRGLFETLGIAA